MIPGGASVSTATGVPVPGSVGRQTGRSATAARIKPPATTRLRRRMSVVSGGTFAADGDVVISVPAIAAAAPSGHHARPRWA